VTLGGHGESIEGTGKSDGIGQSEINDTEGIGQSDGSESDCTGQSVSIDPVGDGKDELDGIDQSDGIGQSEGRDPEFDPVGIGQSDGLPLSRHQ